MQEHNDAMKTSRHSSLEKYTSHIIWKGSKGLQKVLLCERWVGDWTELQHIDPHSYGHIGVSFPFFWAAERGAWWPSLSGTWSSFQYLLSNSLELPVRRVILLFYATQFNLSTVKVIPLIPSTGCTCYLHRCISYFDSSAGVNMQQLCLSPRVEEPNSKVNRAFVPEATESACVFVLTVFVYVFVVTLLLVSLWLWLHNNINQMMLIEKR